MRTFLRLLLVLLAVAALAIVAGALYARGQLHASLPLTDGVRDVGGLSAPVTITRDALSVPSIAAITRADAARALGFLHAQERFFQMDLQRRQAAGELAALVGSRALALDRDARVHRFRTVARQALTQADPDYRAVLDAYAGGVNSGLAALGAPPFEYLILRQTPQPWAPEDSILTVLAMFNTLQGRQASFEAAFGTLHDTMPPAMYGFLTALGSDWDAPVTGGPFPRPGLPGPADFDLRRSRNVRPAKDAELTARHCVALPTPLPDACLSPDESAHIGSNNWAVAGTRTSSGGALLANDMHLAINVPNIWYRAVIQVGPLRLAGVTLPGLPSMVVGSNGRVAWGFTNSGGDWSDLVIIEPDPRDPSKYLAPGGSRAFDEHVEHLAASDGPGETLTVRATMWGPIVGKDLRGREIAQRWVAHDASALSSDVTRPERARTLEEALDAFANIGIPAQNVAIADSTGRIGWTIGGPIPRRVGHDGSRPTSWADGTRGWNGYLPAAEFPRIVDPQEGRLWTANAPVVDGAMLAAIGEGGYADGIRARLIRDRLRAIDKATEHDMLAVQLDDTALFHERWRALVLQTLTPDVVRGHAPRGEFRRLVETTWTGKASPDSVAYRLVREFRSQVSERVMNAVTAAARAADPGFAWARVQRSEGPLWAIVSARPPHMLDSTHATWEALLVAAIDEAITELTAEGRVLSERTWGEYNRAGVTHPLGGAIPLLGRWLNMPRDPLDGDVYTPRAASPRTGASERLVVSPGREQEGILHMPTGQSGHPLSPHYRDQHAAWVNGEPLPLLPGPPVSTLTLAPGSR